MFPHTRSEIGEGLCDCSEYLFYYPKEYHHIYDDIYDWVKVGNEWHKLKYTVLDLDVLMEIDCVFAHDILLD